MLDNILANWKLVAIGALVVVVVYLVLKNTRLIAKVKELEAKTLSLEAPMPQAAPVAAPQPVPPKQVGPHAVPKPLSRPATHAVPQAAPRPVARAAQQADSPSSSDDEGFDVDDEYVAIEKYGNDEKELIIPININSLLQRAIEQQIIPPNPKVESIASASEHAQEPEASQHVAQAPAEESFFLPDAEAVEPEGEDEGEANTESDLRKKNIVALKEMAKELGIKVNDGRKPKNKETLIAEILSKRQNI
jgi:hypothetical protein